LIAVENGVPLWVLITSPLATLAAALGGTYVGGYLQLKRERENREETLEQRRADRREDDLRAIQEALGPVLSAAGPLFDLRTADPATPASSESMNVIMETSLPVLAGATRIGDADLLEKVEELGSLAATLTDEGRTKAELREAIRELGSCARDIVRRTGDLLHPKPNG
jgi:hypothetical protein